MEKLLNKEKKISLEEGLHHIQMMLKGYKKINDYQTLSIKQEKINKKVNPEEKIIIKFKKPYSIYLKWISKAHKGRESIYVEKKNNNKIIAHEGGLLRFITLTVDPFGPIAMKGNRHPITELGFEPIIKNTEKDIKRAIKEGKKDYIIYDRGRQNVYGRDVQIIERIIYEDKNKSYYSWKFHAYIDVEHYLPIAIINWDFNKELMEKYVFKDLRINTGLTDKDFSIRNKDYKFK